MHRQGLVTWLLLTQDTVLLVIVNIGALLTLKVSQKGKEEGALYTVNTNFISAAYCYLLSLVLPKRTVETVSAVIELNTAKQHYVMLLIAVTTVSLIFKVTTVSIRNVSAARVSDSEEEDVPQAKIKKKTVKPSFAKIEFVKPKGKTARKTAKQVEQLRQNTHTPRGNQRNWNNLMSQRLGRTFKMFNKACFVCGSFDHL
ncbi:hypothetical protein Tco_1073094 [Tanacetum coccineum]